MTPTTKAGRALLEPMMREALIADMSDPARFDALPADRSGHIRDRLDAYTRALIAAMKDARADEAEALRAALEKALECIHDAERELHVWVDRDRVRHPGWPDVGYEPWSNKPSLALWSVEVDEVERMALAALATPAAPVAASERCPYPHQYDPSGESRCPIHELCRAPIGTYDGVEGGRPWCAVPCPHAPSGASGGRGVTDLLISPAIEQEARADAAEALRAALRDCRSALISEHGHDSDAFAPWPSCLPVHIALNRALAALATPAAPVAASERCWECGWKRESHDLQSAHPGPFQPAPAAPAEDAE